MSNVPIYGTEIEGPEGAIVLQASELAGKEIPRSRPELERRIDERAEFAKEAAE